MSSLDRRRSFFDGIAEDWDTRAGVDRLLHRIRKELPRFGLRKGERVLDIGCGTGNLTEVLAAVVGPTGKITAIDLSLSMIKKARTKNPGRRIEWVECDATRAPFGKDLFDRVFCYSAWPHFPQHEVLARELWRVLRKEGQLHIWHSISRAEVNQIHNSAGPPISDDLLPPATEVIRLLKANGFEVENSYDNETGFLVSAVKADRL